MTNLYEAVAAFLTAWIGAIVLTPIVARLARRLGAIYAPDGRRKSQLEPVPRGGGVAVTMATVLVMVIASFFTPFVAATEPSAWLERGLPLAIAVLLVLIFVMQPDGD